jgi:NTE family protein
LNLTPAARALGVLLLLGAGVLVMYNVAAIAYKIIRPWPRLRLLVGTLLLNTFIYAYPWMFSPKDWSQPENFSLIPFFFRRSWPDGLDRYGILWFLPGLIMVGVLSYELWMRRKESAPDSIVSHSMRGDVAPIVNRSFEELRKSGDLRIGLILSGGGAKGVYQAGAMRAIYEFLKGYESLGQVKMIAGTSIGSWNSLFWLSDLIAAEPGKMSVHEEWWQTTNIARIIEFDKYVPFLQNSMLNSRPWRENFDAVFSKSSLPSVLRNHDGIHFYLTRSNVAQGRLEFSTNWGLEQRERALQSDDIQVDSFTETRTLEGVRDAVFASMDLPPLFPYQKIGYEYFEDGGVIDNLPIRFGTLVEECDLLFVLALNASFEETPSQHSIVQRLARVNDVRQGVLERNSMRLAYLYNHINYLRDKNDSAAVKAKKLVRIFAICPEQPLIVNTSEFWKTADFGMAFNTMFDATQVELSRFDFAAVPAVASENHDDWLRMALVSSAGEITYNYRF